MVCAMGAFGSLGSHKDNGYNPHECQRSNIDRLHNILNWFPIQLSRKCKVAGWCMVCGYTIVILYLALTLCSTFCDTHSKYLTSAPHYLSSVLHVRRKSSERLSNLPTVTELGRGRVCIGPRSELTRKFGFLWSRCCPWLQNGCKQRPKWDWEWERFIGEWHPQMDKTQCRLVKVSASPTWSSEATTAHFKGSCIWAEMGGPLYHYCSSPIGWGEHSKKSMISAWKLGWPLKAVSELHSLHQALKISLNGDLSSASPCLSHALKILKNSWKPLSSKRRVFVSYLSLCNKLPQNVAA